RQEKKLKQIKAEGSDKSAIEKICTGAYEDGLKSLVLEGTKETLIAVLKTLPFGGIAATACESIVRLIENSV
ncbi:MAG: hypothetical protein K6G54_00510, partial [Oscillospiraceae bacterium]|nr:hypothetical protein [Oscillospiraceae bacterium]